jgi:nicotinamide mononucleotide transporter
MSIHEWADLLLHLMKGTDALQLLAIMLGVAEVLLAKSNKILLYPVGIASTLLSIYILILAGLYAESLLNGYYVVMSIYGWWYWIRKKNLPPLRISYCRRKDWITVTWIVAGGFILLFFTLKYFTPSTVPVWDSWVSTTAWAGMWLLAKRKIENWILLNISNLFDIPLLVIKQLPLFAALTLFLFIVAVFGYFEWRKIIYQEKMSLA